MKESQLFDLIVKTYSDKEYVVVDQVRGAGIRSAGIADAIAIGLWKSRDPRIHGFEIKTSRASWLVELANPAKAEEFAPYCHQWWIVASSLAIVDPAELPRGWGLFVKPEGRGHLNVIVKADEVSTPRPLDAAFLGRLVKAILDRRSAGSTADELAKQHTLGLMEGRQQAEREAVAKNKSAIDTLTEHLHEARKDVLQLQESLGVDFSNMDWKAIKDLGAILKEYRLLDYDCRILPKKVEDMVSAYKFLNGTPLDEIAIKLLKLHESTEQISKFIEKHLLVMPEPEGSDWKTKHLAIRMKEQAKGEPKIPTIFLGNSTDSA